MKLIDYSPGDVIQIQSKVQPRNIIVQVLLSDSSVLMTTDLCILEGTPSANSAGNRGWHRRDLALHTFSKVSKDKNPEYFL